MAGIATELVDALHDHVGDSLRTVGHHSADEWTFDYVRDELQDAYDEGDLDAIAEELALNELESDYQERLYELGDLGATVRLFDRGSVVHVPTAPATGYLVSLDDDADVNARDIIALVHEHDA
ncbi:DUF7522 family protein [Halobacterium jilantaiense]|uniref:Uncharacterized protein n=1 Tax=Halobacterium jilantaiense TaxID=355548 RepID=A0A1I0N7G9_9EURY|nr:hypothetical protein [Halobacterium jilantaiense]SEV97085.1 hypothetical protein SAMN04487945_0661 [Halobacterium jilantaiense]